MRQRIGQEKFAQHDFDAASSSDAKPEWRVNRIDVRSPLSQLRGHIVRVEIDHAERGRLTDIASGNDILGAAFAAVAHIVGVKASIVSIESIHRSRADGKPGEQAIAAIVVEIDGLQRRGCAAGQDLIYACLAGFIDALTNAHECNHVGLSSRSNEDDEAVQRHS